MAKEFSDPSSASTVTDLQSNVSASVSVPAGDECNNRTTAFVTPITSVNSEEPHFGRFDIRVGKIVGVEKHPDADSLYIEKVDVGEENPRTIISGLVKHVTIEEMQNRTALFLVNLKPIKMRGILSYGMIMCAHNDEGRIEILIPPNTSQPGDFVSVDGYERKPDARIDARKKTFEVIQKNLRTNDNREATYKGIPWKVADKGPVLSLTLTNASIS